MPRQGLPTLPCPARTEGDDHLLTNAYLTSQLTNAPAALIEALLNALDIQILVGELAGAGLAGGYAGVVE
jgi:hypothetical protein